MSYYTSVIIMCCLGLGALCICVWENDRLSRPDKMHYYLTYLLIALAAGAEWLGVFLNGNGDIPSFVLPVVKCADYILTPIAGGFLVKQTRIENTWSSLLDGVLAFNTGFQVLSLFTGWMVRVDSTNTYSHGPLYVVYMIVYLVVVVITVVEFVLYGKLYRRQNRRSLYAVLALTIAGVGMQEVFSGVCRTAYLSLTMASILLYVHITEFSQLAADDQLEAQEKQLVTDPLTGILNRAAYIQDTEKLGAAPLPRDLVIFAIDLDGLKGTNDTRGHAAGDELIRGAAECISSTFSEVGKCYRVGGDEFMVIARTDSARARRLFSQLEETCAQWKGKKSKKLRMAVGFVFAADHPGASVEELARTADMAMYEVKKRLYGPDGNPRGH